MLRSLVLTLSPPAAPRPRILRTLARWLARRRQRLALRALDARLLDDVGLTPRQAAREAAKPCWRA